jgi:hypothetical protein
VSHRYLLYTEMLYCVLKNVNFKRHYISDRTDTLLNSFAHSCVMNKDYCVFYLCSADF